MVVMYFYIQVEFIKPFRFLCQGCCETARGDQTTKISEVTKPHTPWVSQNSPQTNSQQRSRYLVFNNAKNTYPLFIYL